LYTYVQVRFAGVSLLGAVFGFAGLGLLCPDRALLAFLEDVFGQVVAWNRLVIGFETSTGQSLPLYNNDADRVDVFIVLRSLSTLVPKF
jgi:hypothetical protein